MLNVAMLYVIMLNVAMLSVVVPLHDIQNFFQSLLKVIKLVLSLIYMFEHWATAVSYFS